MKIYRNTEGTLINIGEWVYLYTEDQEGNKVVLNPIPDGAYEEDEEVVKASDGGLYLASDPRALI